jgi:hypothetical protein
MSVILVCHDTYDTIRLAVTHITAQTVRESLELVIAAPSRERLGLVESDLKNLHSYQVIEVGEVLHRGAAAAAAIRAARGPIVGMVENHSFPDPEWAEVLIKAHEGPWAGVCPMIEIFNPKTLVSRTERLIDYGMWIARTEATEIDRLPWHNSSYKRDLVMQFDDDLEKILDPEYHLQDRLRAQGHRFYLDPRARTRHISDSKFSSACSAMFGRGRIFAASRSENWSLAKRLAYVLASPLFPFILLYLIRDNFARFHSRYPAYRLLPAALLFAGIVALGECAGYLAGAGDSITWMARHELEIELRANKKEIEQLKSLLAQRVAQS